MTASAETKLRVAGVGHVYAGIDGVPLPVLCDISFDVARGEFITLIGGSGSGKTTLLRIIDHLIAPTSGTIFVDGQPVRRPGGKISFVFQTDSLLPWRTVIDNVAYGLRPSRRWEERRA